jgi:hypothetical protein
MNKELNKTAKSFYELIKAINNLKTENMKFKGQLKGFPKEVVNKMLERQVEQGNELNKFVYENENIAGRSDKGFTWQNTIEGHEFWSNVINKKDFDLFFQKYPK